MSPPIYTPDGQEVTEIVLPDGSTASEVVAPDGSVVFADIPDIVGHQYISTDTTESDGQTVDQWSDGVGSVKLTAVGDPTLNSDGLNGNDSITLDGNDAYNYGSYSISEPCAIIWAYSLDKTALGSGIGTLVEDDGGGSSRQDTNILLRGDNDEYQMREMDGTALPTSSTALVDGDQIVTLLVDDKNADLRVNGTNEISTGSSDSVNVLTSNYGWYYSVPESGRHVPCEAGAVVVYPNTRLSGDALTNEEQRIENEFGMSVL
jgi:hypothetical protein